MSSGLLGVLLEQSKEQIRRRILGRKLTALKRGEELDRLPNMEK